MASIKDVYEKLHIIGKGSYATVWKVRHKELGYVRALKISKEEVENENDPAYQKFLKECKMLLKIGNGSHPNIVHIYKPDLIDNRAVVEMDFIDGETFQQYLQRVKFLSIDEVCKFIDNIVGALAFCHHDIYHYLMNPNEDDLKPDPKDGHKYIIDDAKERELVQKYAVTHNDLHSSNVMRRNYDGSFILLDFGLAIQNGDCARSSARRGGALEYMAPEKFDTNNITTQSDIYSIGILLYEVLTGRVPFILKAKDLENPTPTEINDIYEQHKTSIPPSIEKLRRESFEKTFPGQTYVKDFPYELEAIIFRCLEKDPSNRYPDAKALYEDIKKIIANNNEIELREQLLKADSTIEMLNGKIEKETKNVERLQKINGSLTDTINDLNNEINRLNKEKNTSNGKKNHEVKKNIMKLFIENWIPRIITFLLFVACVFIYMLAKELMNDDKKISELEKNITFKQLVIQDLESKVIELDSILSSSESYELDYVNLGLPSGTLWKTTNEYNNNDDHGFYTYDEALQNFGSKLPTKEQLEELRENCSWAWNPTKKGYDVKGQNNNSIFLPAAGDKKCNGEVCYIDEVGYYWSRTNKSNEALYFWCNSIQLGYGECDRCFGLSVRLVNN